MGLERDFLGMASTTVQVEPLSTHNQFGGPVYGAAVTYTAVVQEETRRFADANGFEEVPGTAVYVLSSSARVGMGDRITIRGSCAWRIRTIFHDHDDEGQHHVEVFAG